MLILVSIKSNLRMVLQVSEVTKGHHKSPDFIPTAASLLCGKALIHLAIAQPALRN